MTQSIKNFVHPSVARARKEAALECAKIAAELSKAGGTAEQVRELIVVKFGLSYPYDDPRTSSVPRNQYTDTRTPD